MEYNFTDIEAKAKKKWADNQTYRTTERTDKPKYYVLDMFPYPSGAGLHVGHPLGYIASDIYARYKRHLGFNVLHPMGYDSFGLPAEQYAIQTGQHPALTTETNIARYREQLEKIGFCYDWAREVRTSNADYYRWTQWIFAQIFSSWYNMDTDRAEDIKLLISQFEKDGNANVKAAMDENWHKELDGETTQVLGEGFSGKFTAAQWNALTEVQKEKVLMHYRLTYLADSWVNWCPALGTVLANDEVKDGVSERGGHPVEQKRMKQWSMRISAYADRLLRDLDTLDWSESIKEIQRNWIGRSEGASVSFALENSFRHVEVFTTRPDTIFGVSFMVLAPEHPLVREITTSEYSAAVETYQAKAKLKTERDRQTNVKDVSGQFTGAYALHPFTGAKIPVWIGEYVLAGYGTGAIMAVPAGDQRDWDFAQKMNLPIPPIFVGHDASESALEDKTAVLRNSSFVGGLSGKVAIRCAIAQIEAKGIGQGKVNYRLRDAIFSRQRYWGEPFPVYYQDGMPRLVGDSDLPVTLPEVDKYLPTEDGEPPLARAKDWHYKGQTMEHNTMPGWAGSSWYFLRYMDPKNERELCGREKSDYWGQVDLYMGGAEHATGHLLYARFWTKFLHDRGIIGFGEPFKKMINQGMILGRSSFVFRAMISGSFWGEKPDYYEPEIFVSSDIVQAYVHSKGEEQEQLRESISIRIRNIIQEVNPDRTDLPFLSLGGADLIDNVVVPFSKIHADISLVSSDMLDIEAFKKWRPEFADAQFLLNEAGQYVCGTEVEKMSKSKYNVQTPDELVEKYGADTLRCYEMFLGPVEQSKPWDTNGISGVYGFLRKVWRLYNGPAGISEEAATKAELKALHKAIRKVTEDLERLQWNTVVSTLMICTNELTELKCNKRAVLEVLPVLLSPYAPHLAEDLWDLLGVEGRAVDAAWPTWDEAHLTEDTFEYPVAFNGKTRFFLPLAAGLDQQAVTEAVLGNEQTAKYLAGGAPKKVIVVLGRMVNVVV